MKHFKKNILFLLHFFLILTIIFLFVLYNRFNFITGYQSKCNPPGSCPQQGETPVQEPGGSSGSPPFQCGDNICEGNQGEDSSSCPEDCAVCGDNSCAGQPWETEINCPIDCAQQTSPSGNAEGQEQVGSSTSGSSGPSRILPTTQNYEPVSEGGGSSGGCCVSSCLYSIHSYNAFSSNRILTNGICSCETGNNIYNSPCSPPSSSSSSATVSPQQSLTSQFPPSLSPSVGRIFDFQNIIISDKETNRVVALITSDGNEFNIQFIDEEVENVKLIDKRPLTCFNGEFDDDEECADGGLECGRICGAEIGLSPTTSKVGINVLWALFLILIAVYLGINIKNIRFGD